MYVFAYMKCKHLFSIWNLRIEERNPNGHSVVCQSVRLSQPIFSEFTGPINWNFATVSYDISNNRHIVREPLYSFGTLCM